MLTAALQEPCLEGKQNGCKQSGDAALSWKIGELQREASRNSKARDKADITESCSSQGAWLLDEANTQKISG